MHRRSKIERWPLGTKLAHRFLLQRILSADRRSIAAGRLASLLWQNSLPAPGVGRAPPKLLRFYAFLARLRLPLPCILFKSTLHFLKFAGRFAICQETSPELAPAICGRMTRPCATPASLYSRTGAFGSDCSNRRKREADAEDAARQRPRYGQGTPVGSTRSASHNSHSAMATAAPSADPEYPSHEGVSTLPLKADVAERDRHVR
jgi:hypothetical protein